LGLLRGRESRAFLPLKANNAPLAAPKYYLTKKASAKQYRIMNAIRADRYGLNGTEASTDERHQKPFLTFKLHVSLSCLGIR